MLDIVGFKFNIPDIEEREQHLSISYVKLLGRLCDAKYIYLTCIEQIINIHLQLCLGVIDMSTL